MNHDEFGTPFESEKSFGKSFEDKYKLNMLEIEKRFVKLETAMKEVLDVMEQIEDSVNVEQAGLEELKKILEERQGQQPRPQQGMQDIQGMQIAKGETTNEMKNELKNEVKSEVISEIRNEMMNEMRQVRAEMEHGMARFQSVQNVHGIQGPQSLKGQHGAGTERMGEQVEMLKRRMSDIEDSVQSIAEFSKMQLQPTRSSVYEREVNDLLEKIVFLESKVSTLEQLFSGRTQQETRRQDVRTEIVSRPLIME